MVLSSLIIHTMPRKKSTPSKGKKGKKRDADKTTEVSKESEEDLLSKVERMEGEVKASMKNLNLLTDLFDLLENVLLSLLFIL